MARSNYRFIPRLESFDERALPSVTITESPGGFLQITGDRQENSIAIVDDGTSNPGNVTVFVDGQPFPSTGVITDIVVQTLGGKDSVDYTLAPGVMSESRTVVVDLGRRPDMFAAHIDGVSVQAGQFLLVQAFGGTGDDTFTVDADLVNVGLNGRLQVDLVGGRGTDVFTVNGMPGVIDGTFLINQQQD
jgi:hypothetical protein